MSEEPSPTPEAESPTLITSDEIETTLTALPESSDLRALLQRVGDKIISNKDKALLYLYGIACGGSHQAFAEWSKQFVPDQVEFYKEKFPDGMRLKDIPEEAMEGGISAAVGMSLGQLTYGLIRKSRGYEYNQNVERLYTLTGGIFGYTTMIFTGATLHRILDTPDVKWGPFH